MMHGSRVQRIESAVVAESDCIPRRPGDACPRPYCRGFLISTIEEPLTVICLLCSRAFPLDRTPRAVRPPAVDPFPSLASFQSPLPPGYHRDFSGAMVPNATGRPAGGWDRQRRLQVWELRHLPTSVILQRMGAAAPHRVTIDRWKAEWDRVRGPGTAHRPVIARRRGRTGYAS